MNRFTCAAKKEEEHVKLQSSVTRNSNSLTTQIYHLSSTLLAGLFLHYMAAEHIQTCEKPRFIKAQ